MPSYHDQLKALAESIGSDGCTHIPDMCIECCWEHDWTYVTGMTPRGVIVTKEYADYRFRDCIQARMSLRWFSPLSWLYWLGVKKFGGGIWDNTLIKPLYANKLMNDNEGLEEARQARIRILNEMK